MSASLGSPSKAKSQPYRRKRSIRSVLAKTVQDYADISTTHGINYVCNSNMMVVERFLWFVVCCSFLTLAVWWTVEAYNKWEKYPVITSVGTTGIVEIVL